MSLRRSSLVTMLFVAVGLLFAFVVHRRALVGWFGGEPEVSRAGDQVSATAGPFMLRAALDPDPPRQSNQALRLAVHDATGRAVDDAIVDVVYDMPAMGTMAEMKGGARVSNQRDGRYRATFDLPMPGSWTLRVIVRASSGRAAQDFAMTVGSPGLSAEGAAAVPSEDAGSSDEGVVTIEEARRQLIGVRTASVTEGPMRHHFRAVGQVAYDESSLSDVTLKVRGWITKLYVNETGQRVSHGQTLFTLYSPELFNAEQDFLLALRSTSTLEAAGNAGRVGPLGTAARERLRLLGLDDEQIDAIARQGTPLQSLAFKSPTTGFIIEKNVVEGTAIDPGARLYRIASLSKVWVEAEIYESDFANVQVGQNATVTLDYLPGQSYEAKIAYVYPYLDATTRTGRIRIELANTGLDLRPGMFANVALASDLGVRVQVPASAVVYTGPRRIVFVDLGQGRFMPREIQVGSESEATYEVLSGLRAGEIVATSGIFLIAAEARIRTASPYWSPPSLPSDTDATGPEPSAWTTVPGAQPPVRTSSMRAVPPARSSAPPAGSSPDSVIYTCPMHPDVQSPQPGNCPTCGMKLVPKGSP